MKVTPIMSYALLGTDTMLKAGRIYDAEHATNQPDWVAESKVFVDGVLLRKGEYVVMEEQRGIGAVEAAHLLEMIDGHLQGTKDTGRWLNSEREECDEADDDAEFFEYDEEEQRLWLDTLAGMMERMRDYIHAHASVAETGTVELVTRQRDKAREYAHELHASLGECLLRHARARVAAAEVIARWESPLWKDAPGTAGYIYALRDALRDEKHIQNTNNAKLHIRDKESDS